MTTELSFTMIKKKVVVRPPKIKKPFVIAQQMAMAGRISYRQHAIDQMIERKVDIADVVHVIKTGRHKPQRDQYSESEGWSYGFEGLDIDEERTIRVALAIKNDIYVVTVIDITRKSNNDGYN